MFGIDASDETITLASTPEERRRAAWTDLMCQKYYPVDIEYGSPAVSTARISIVDIGELRACKSEGDPVTLFRRRHHIKADGGDYYLMQMPAHSSIWLSQGGREAQVRPADLALVASSQCYRLSIPVLTTIFSLRFPGPLVRNRIPCIEDVTAHRLPVRRSSVALFLDFARSLWMNGRDLDEDEAATAVNGLINLFAIAVSRPELEISEADETSVRIAHRNRVMRIIDTHMNDPKLTPAFVAQEMKISERYLQKIFAVRGKTLTQVIRARRIGEARSLLSASGDTNKSISTIAYSTGFSEPSYFNRVFRQETGMTPSEFREASKQRKS